jgi:hypothetical protein
MDCIYFQTFCLLVDGHSAEIGTILVEIKALSTIDLSVQKDSKLATSAKYKAEKSAEVELKIIYFF